MRDNDDLLDQTADQFGTARPIVNPQPDDDPPPQVAKVKSATGLGRAGGARLGKSSGSKMNPTEYVAKLIARLQAVAGDPRSAQK